MSLRKSLYAFFALAMLCISGQSYAFDLNNLAKDLTGNESVGNLVDGVLSTSDVDVKDLVGTWKSCGPAVVFKSHDILKKAGGAAASAAIVSKLEPYYQKAGLENMTFTVDATGKFTMTLKKGKVTGTITKVENGAFTFNFNAFGKHKIGAVKTYVQKGTKLDVMFDVSKLIDIVSKVGSIAGNSTVDSAIKLLKSYDGLCAGFAFK
ncbi:MAG: DUF4923 family protein [Muribaculaceae bacterium]